MTGGWKEGTVNDVDNDIDQFVRTEYPELKDAELIGTATQVVAGINYKYVYQLDNVKYKVTTWDQSWTKHR